jgi:2-polyprenyl-3-methyl-5-hydroxy-6-metoxy-1,4-benzoquinol methylase
MENKNIFESNRTAWNQALEYHQKAQKDYYKIGFENPDFTTFNSDYDKIVLEKLCNIDFKSKVISQMQCRNGSDLISLMKLGAGEAVGFDISDTAISEAEQLAEISKLNVKFIRTNILEIDDKYNNYFDFIFITEGSLQWFPDLNDYFKAVSKLLKKDGQIFISEMHPFVYFFENDFDFKKQNFDKLPSYFSVEPYNYETGIDYIGGTEYESTECFWFMHKISDIITALIKNGIDIQSFDEYDIGNTSYETEELLGKFPLSYIIIGEKYD